MKIRLLLSVVLLIVAGYSQSLLSGVVGSSPTIGGGTVATPTDSPGAGTYASTQSVTLATGTSGASICYTIDGTTPGATTAGTCNSSPTTLYTGAVSVSATTTIKALATKATFTNSSVLSSAYTITAPSFLFSGFGCNAAGSNTCTVGGSTQSGLTGFQLGAPFTTGSNALGYTVGACGANLTALDGTNPQFHCGIYTSASSGSTNVCHDTSEVTPGGTGWSENTNFTGCSLSASTSYIVVLQLKGSGTSLSNDGGTSNTRSYTGSGDGYGGYGTWSSVNWNGSAANYSVYAKISAN